MKPRQRAARERWAQRVKAIGVVLDSLNRQVGPLEDVYASRGFHVSTVSRLTKIPETSLRRIADESFPEIQVPGHVVGWGQNRFFVALNGERAP